MVNIKDRVKKVLGKNKSRTDSDEDVPMTEREARLIPTEIQTFIERYRKSKALLEQMVKLMVAVLDKWSLKPTPAHEQPSPNNELTTPFRCAAQLEPITMQKPQIPGALTEVCMAAHATFKDLAVLERQHLIQLHQSVVERVFMQYLVNEAPGVERIIRQMNEAAKLLTQALERCEANANAANKKALSEANHDFDIIILEVRSHQTAFPERQRAFAEAMQEFVAGLQAHYTSLNTSVTSTLQLLEKATTSDGRG